jgi:uncharacterized membrane protein
MEPISKVNLERITNGIYAFTMTLMVRNIQTPPPGSITSEMALEQYLTTTTHSIIDFVGAFLILGMFWLFYFQMFHRMKTYDFRFLYLHLVSLMVVVFVPFTQSLAAQNTVVPVADVLFQFNYLILSILLTWQWHYARKHPELLVPELTTYEAGYLSKKFLIPLGVAILGIIFIWTGVGYIDLLYFLPFVILAVFMRHGPERIKPAEDKPEERRPEEGR